jgi:hypothetical protein
MRWGEPVCYPWQIPAYSVTGLRGIYFLFSVGTGKASVGSAAGGDPAPGPGTVAGYLVAGVGA